MKFSIVWILAVVAALSACAASRSGTGLPIEQPGKPPLVWPKAPAQERIRYVGQVSKPADWGISRSWFMRLADLLSGSANQVFMRPSAVVERAGVLVVADPGAQVVWILDAPNDSYQRVTHVGQQGLLSPVALALGPADSFYVSDTVLNQVFQIDRAGQLIRTISAQGLERPAAVAWDDATHRLFVLDSKRHRVTVFDGNGALIQHLGASGTDAAQFNHPTHMALDAGTPGGHLLVTDAMNFRVQSITPQGKFLWKFGQNGNGSGDLAAPKGLASDSAGNVYVVDAIFDTVQIFNRQGRFLLAFGEHGSEPGQLSLPRGIFISTEDKVYVADTYNQRIQIFLDAVAPRLLPQEVAK